MKKTALIFLSFATFATASEFQYGEGTFSMKGGFLGLTGDISTDITAYSLVERHSNISDFFYGYDITWYDSEVMKQEQHRYNSMLPNNSNLDVLSMEHRFKGLDVNVKVGYDVIHENQDNFLGVGLLVGLSVPDIDDASSENNSNPLFRKSSDSSDELMVKSKTKIKTYKIGATVSFQKSFNKKISLYGTGSYAYQTGEIENEYADAKYTVDGSFQEYDFGLYFTPFTESYSWGWLSLSPRIYATLGYKYRKWDVDEMAINLSGSQMSSDILEPFATKFSMDSSIGYFGIGYSF